MRNWLVMLLAKTERKAHHKWAWAGVGVATVGLLSASMVWATAGTEKTERPNFERVVERLPLPQINLQKQPTRYWMEYEIGVGDNFKDFLRAQGMSETGITELIQKNFQGDMPRIHAGQLISVQLDQNDELQAFQFFHDAEDGEKNLVALEKQQGVWQVSSNIADTETIVTMRAITVQTSARGALARAGVPVEIRETINELFSDQFSLDDLQEGDAVRVIFENHFFRGQPIATGNIQAVEVRHKGKTHQAFYYEHGEDNGAFYSGNGRPLSKGGFSVEPVKYSRISSPFGTRFHPILQVWKSHAGIDYAAPSGTPIVAPAAGVIEEVGVKGGYGYAIVIRHRNNLETLYGHMSAFASGMRPGKAVQPGEVIGFVGSTGRSTGPHLHYEVRVGGQAVNPATAALPVRQLTKKDIDSFLAIQSADNKRFAQIRHLRVMVAQLD